MATSPADRGKSLEQRFRALCKEQENRQGFAFHRFPDARAGSRKEAPADYQTMSDGIFRLIECKECKYDGRLPYGNFDKAQVGRMRLWALAGKSTAQGRGFVLVHHTTKDNYTVAKVENFIERKEGKGSWFFNEMPHQVFATLEEAFNYIHEC